MIVLAVLLVISSGLMHALWNLFTKQSQDKVTFLWIITLPTTILLLPIALIELYRTELQLSNILFLLLTMLIQSIYGLLLAKAYTVGDMSQVYPIMRGTPTLLIPLFSLILFGESLRLAGWFGITLLVVGFVIMSGWTLGKNQVHPPIQAIWISLLIGLCTTTYTLIDKINVGYFSPLAILALSNLGFVSLLTPIALRKGRMIAEFKLSSFRNILLASLLSPFSYLLFLYALPLAPVGYLAPLREIGTVFGTVLGILILKEAQGTRRIIASIIIVFAIIAIGLWG